MDSSKTSSASGANCCRLAITESYGVARSSLGTPSRAPRDSNGDVTPAAPACSRNVNLTVPENGLLIMMESLDRVLAHYGVEQFTEVESVCVNLG